MIRKGFVYEVKVELLLTVVEVAILMVLSERHYDGHCKSVGKSGGFLYGLSNMVEWAKEEDRDIPSLLTWHQVDTLCKILEQARGQIQVALYMAMSQLLSSMSNEERRTNNLP